MDNSKIYLDEHRIIQDELGTRKLADRQEELIVHDVFTDDEIEFISTRDMFFISTMNSREEPTVSYKGGPSGFISVENNELIFPSYNGNGMFLTVGNLARHHKVGLLFIDFETPRRLRVQGLARLDKDCDLRPYPGAELIVRITPTEIWVNCPRYIHTYKKVCESPYTPADGADARIAQWKRLDSIVDSLCEVDRAEALKAGVISLQEYNEKIRNNDG